ncbi:ATP-dependent DNA helicase DinG [Aquimonas voraii]|uniref:ATP-dependent DNA helicase DinG n=1 Tax=Aquimonas voraii TaxID=265719 RepID=A0A1G7A7Y6_9GAMM|nr:ATP-dependent DNA helicase DinG [Aquimonas voraii]SDE10881.1 ATP-dependent DNA helicase DinG [Aquimonas voraii]
MSAAHEAALLSEELQEDIRRQYRRLRESFGGFVPRGSQRQMVAAVARALVQDKGALAVEAPTGTGKSMAYLLAALPIAIAQKKKLLVATATVALQEQLVERDIPAFLAATGSEASVVLAKGRQRYACTRNLHELTRSDAELPQGGFDFGVQSTTGAWPRPPRSGEVERLRSLLEALQSGAWDGDLDRSPDDLDDESRRLITTSAGGCSNRRCPFIVSCPFVLARNRLNTAQIIVANHDLVLADLELGRDEDGSGGVLLPAPGETLYVFDEAHQLPDKAIDRGGAEVNLADARRRLQRLAAPLRAVYLATGKERLGRKDAGEIDGLLDELIDGIDRLEAELDAAWPQAVPTAEPLWRASLGQVPEPWRQLAQGLSQRTAELVRWLPLAIKALLESELPPERRETTARELGMARERIEAQSTLWWLWAQDEAADQLPRARWLSRAVDSSITCHASEVSAAPTLRRVLWPQAAGVVLASATLSIGGDFRNYAAQVGLPAHAETLALPSPFDLRRQARLQVPPLQASPDAREAHVREVVNWLERELDWGAGNLVLFTSRAKLEQAVEMLKPASRIRVLAQGSRSKSALLAAHAAAIESGHGSTLFGLASFGEGLDLPGRLCETVVITQLPFAVPTDPVGATYAEWLEARGRNAFVEVSIPQATRTLIQYCGRLIRSERDQGRIVILDNRLMTRRYGARILAALPDFQRELGAPLG